LADLLNTFNMPIKRLFLSFVLLVPLVAFAQTAPKIEKVDKPVACSDAKVLLDGLTKNLKQEPIIIAETKRSRVAFLFTPDGPNGPAWTLVEFNQDVACILAAGEQLSINVPQFLEALVPEKKK
jgi:hypothetical protein